MAGVEKLEYMGTGVFAETPYYERIASDKEDFTIFYDHLLAYNGHEAEGTVPASVNINAFELTPWIEAQRKGDYTIVGDGILLKYHGTSTERLVLPDTIKILESFSIDSPDIRELILPNSLMKIERAAF